MDQLKAVLCAVLVAALCVPGVCWGGDEEVVQSIVKARETVKPLPLPSSKLTGLTADKAYAIQRSMVKAMLAKGQSIGGFKAGFTSEGSQKRFGVKGAVYGVLFKAGELKDGAVVDRKDFVRLFLETEVGYSVNTKIDKPVKDVASLKKLVKEVFPAIELPNLRFDNVKKVTGVDFIADAVSSAKYIVGMPVAPDKVDVSKVELTLAMNGKELFKGKASDVQGGQWNGLLSLVNGVVAQGWTIEPGQVLITGSLGKLVPGKPGKYVADFGTLGKISFTVK
jgi:2-keto-4-pentenoate hydratase